MYKISMDILNKFPPKPQISARNLKKTLNSSRKSVQTSRQLAPHFYSSKTDLNDQIYFFIIFYHISSDGGTIVVSSETIGTKLT